MARPRARRFSPLAMDALFFAGMSGGSGNLVRIAHHRMAYETMYMHLLRILVHVGEHVDAGQRIRPGGNDGPCYQGRTLIFAF